MTVKNFIDLLSFFSYYRDIVLKLFYAKNKLGKTITMASQKSTLQDVAKLAEVSLAAASIALRNLPKSKTFNQATIDRIHAAAKKLGYKANLFSSRSHHSPGKVIMLYFCTLQDLYSSSIAESFQRQATKRGYWTMITVPQDNGCNIFDDRILGGYSINAIAMIGKVVDYVNQKQMSKILDYGVQGVVIGHNKPDPHLQEVLVDDTVGMTKIAEHVYGLGARRVYMVGWHRHSNPKFHDRGQIVMNYAKEHGYPPPIRVNEVKEQHDVMMIDQQAAQSIIEQIQRDGHPPEAIITDLDIRAMGACAALQRLGLQVGRDVAVTGYDDIWPSQVVYPPLTTVHQPTEELGILGADMLIDTLEGTVRPGRSITILPELKIRESTTLWRPRSISNRI